MIFDNITLEDQDFVDKKTLSFEAVQLITNQTFPQGLTCIDFFVFDSRVKHDCRLAPLVLPLNKILDTDIIPEAMALVSEDFEKIKTVLLESIPSVAADGLDFYLIGTELRFCLPEYLIKSNFLKNSDWKHKLEGKDLSVIPASAIEPSFDDNMKIIDLVEDTRTQEAIINILTAESDPTFYENCINDR